MVDMQLMGATMEDIETMDGAIETMEEAMEDIELLTDGRKRHHVRVGAGAKANKRKRQGSRRKHHGQKRRGNKSGKATPMPTNEPTKYYPPSK